MKNKTNTIMCQASPNLLIFVFYKMYQRLNTFPMSYGKYMRDKMYHLPRPCSRSEKSVYFHKICINFKIYLKQCHCI